MNELLSALDINLSFDGELYATSGEVEYFFLFFLCGHAFDGCGSKRSENEFLRAGSVVLIDHRTECANTVGEALEDEFAVFSHQTVSVVFAIGRRHGIALERVVGSNGACVCNFLHFKLGFARTLLEQYCRAGGDLFVAHFREGELRVAGVEFTGVDFHVCGYFHSGGCIERNVSECVGVERELCCLFKEDVAFRFVVCNAEARSVVKFHELVAHFETVATGIERLLEFTLRHNCLLFGFREGVFVLSRVQTETIVQTGEVVAVEVEYSSFSLLGGQLISRSRCLEVFGSLFGTGNIINDDAGLKYFVVISNVVFLEGFCGKHYELSCLKGIDLDGFDCFVQFAHF